MIKIQFTEEDKKALHYERFHYPHPRVQQKMDALLLKSHDLPHATIASILQIDEGTLREYLLAYQQGGIEQLKIVNWHGSQSELFQHQGTLKEFFSQNPPTTAAHAADQIEKLTGIECKPTQIRVFLKQIGMKPLKMGAIPAKADSEVQQKFFQEKLLPQLTQAILGQRVLFFVDASHFVLAPFLCYVWCFARVFIKAPAGRQRFNVLGALNAVTKELTTVCNDSYITAQQVCQLLDKLRVANIGRPITVVLDNAKYQRCALVEEHARSLGIDLLFLPSYSPNLNLIERFWKFVKKDCLYAKYYATFLEFKQAISNCIEQAHVKHAKELQSLLTLRFQTFDKVNSIAA